MTDLLKLSWHLVVWRRVFLSQVRLCWLSREDWEEEGWFSHQSETSLGKTCLMGAWEIFLGLSGETLEGQRRPVKCRTLASLSSQAVRMRGKGSRTYWPNAWDPASHSTVTPHQGWHKRGLFALGLRRGRCYKTTSTELCGHGQSQHIGCQRCSLQASEQHIVKNVHVRQKHAYSFFSDTEI